MPSATRGNPLVNRLRSEYADAYRRITRALRLRRKTLRTEQACEHCLAQFLRFHHWPSTDGVDPSEIASYLEHLALERWAAAATQQVALNAPVLLLREMLGRDLPDTIVFTRSAQRRRPPVVLSPHEVTRLPEAMHGRGNLSGRADVRHRHAPDEVHAPGAQDIDFDYRQIGVHAGKGGRDRVMPLPQRLIPRL